MDPLAAFLKLSLLFWICTAYGAAEKRRLNDYIGHYEGLAYSTQRLHDNHLRAKRSVAQPPVQLRFSSHGRSFHLRLTRDVSTFISNPELEHADGSISTLDISHIYEGTLVDEPGSYVHGSIIDGRFAGKIYTKKHGNYFVDKSEVYFREPQLFHSIMYHEDEVSEDMRRSKRSPLEHSGCGAMKQETRDWMSSVQNSAVRDDQQRFRRSSPEASSAAHNKYSSFYNEPVRNKRSISPFRTCTLFMQSDTELWNYMKRPRSDGGLEITEDDRAYEEITSLFASHVSGIKKIYENTNFQHDNLDYNGFTFVVRRVKINTTADCEGSKHSTNLFCKPNIDVSNFLNLNSLMNHDLFCLAYLFTYRDFTGGTLGLAWVGSPTKASGGICEKYKEYTENGRRIKKSLNTGVVTLVNYNARVPPKVSTLTFAHEVGHNFGSPHDSGIDCVPTTEDPNAADGNFIMFASATSGDRPNNSKFSQCSISNITLVVDAILNPASNKGKYNCFVESQTAFCGNAIREKDEECDCGFEEDCNKTDQCCFPNEDTQNKCTLKPTAKCSPSQGPCCKSDCSKVPQSEGFVCSTENECSEQAVCNGMDASCPIPTAKANLTACNDHTQVCRGGICVGSICEKNPGWEQCYITAPDNDKGFDKGIMCYVACQNPDTGECVSTGDKTALEKTENKPLKDILAEFDKDNIKLMPGAPCDNFMGFCDVFQKCRGVDADGPLARLKNLLFNEETFRTIKDWIITYWWGVLLMGLALVICMGLFIHLCAVHTPSSNPNAPKARKLTLKPQRRQQGPPPAYIAGPSRAGPAPGRGRGGAHQGGANVSQPPPYTSYEMKGQQRRV